jgi:hypothetical protein
VGAEPRGEAPRHVRQSGEQVGDQGAGVRCVQRRDRQLRDRRLRGGQRGPRSRDEHEHRGRLGEAPGEMARQPERRGRERVGVVHDQHEGAATGQRQEERRQRDEEGRPPAGLDRAGRVAGRRGILGVLGVLQAEQAQDGGLGVHLGRRGRPGQLEGGATHQNLHLDRGDLRRIVGPDLRQRAQEIRVGAIDVGVRTDAGGARGHPGGRALRVVRAREPLGDEARLADARRPQHLPEPAASRSRVCRVGRVQRVRAGGRPTNGETRPSAGGGLERAALGPTEHPRGVPPELEVVAPAERAAQARGHPERRIHGLGQALRTGDGLAGEHRRRAAPVIDGAQRQARTRRGPPVEPVPRARSVANAPAMPASRR